MSVTETHTDPVAMSQAEFIKFLKEIREAERVESARIRQEKQAISERLRKEDLKRLEKERDAQRRVHDKQLK